jgi:hypothetical protein
MSVNEDLANYFFKEEEEKTFLINSHLSFYFKWQSPM